MAELTYGAALARLLTVKAYPAASERLNHATEARQVQWVLACAPALSVKPDEGLFACGTTHSFTLSSASFARVFHSGLGNIAIAR